MAAPRDATPFVPSLLQCATLPTARLLLQEFGVDALEHAYADIQEGNLTASEGARESLLCVPAHMRRRVMEAARGTQRAVSEWARKHHKFKEQKGDLCWRGDGSVDTYKTAQNLVRNARVDLRDRFKLACAYFMEDSVKDLWAALEASGEAESFETCYEHVVSFWVHWLREEPRVPWKESLRDWMRRYPDFLMVLLMTIRSDL